ncbi:hypothetical protein J0X19_22060 [Hymenobacter sp. BT186]|uniref:Replication protein n=1 Tax=Hymenobacter telluris TaxID=2816474 RepID=A0A939F0T5_9BACT|nr:hypothetical protein [Hymenobacter telluris]MBO0360661.1 hypothetical protein [Hymenobacter telluris]MBW3376688.1 hypothetical protein [Hymenobacter norwichensis]
MSTPSPTTAPVLLTVDTSLLRWHLRVDSLWQCTPRSTHIRQMADGTQKVISRRGQRLVSDGAKWTGEFLIKRARKVVQRLLNSGLLYGVLVTDTGVQMPSILVNAKELNEKRTLTERTMRTHLKQLEKVGLITRKKGHGSNASFELWINPAFVWETAQNAVEIHTTVDSLTQPAARPLSPNGNKFPHTEVLETDVLLKKEPIGDVDKYHADGFSGNPSQETEGDNPEGADAGQASKRAPGGRGAAPAAPDTSPAQDAATAARTAYNAAFVEQTWQYAKALIYTNQRFSPEQERLAKRAIWTGVYGGFPADFGEWETFHAGVLRRIELVQEHFVGKQLRGEKAWAPLPWAEMIPGRGYFDWENVKGFRGTYDWLRNDLKAKDQERINVAIGKAYGELKLRRLLDRGEAPKFVGRRKKVPAYIENTTLLALFRQHEKNIQRLGGKDAVRKFLLKVNALFS